MAAKEPLKRIRSLTREQWSAMVPFAREWIESDLSTEPADRSKVERGIRAAYNFANLGPPKRIVWVDSPAILFIAAPLAALTLTLRRHGVDVAIGTVVDLAVGRGAGTGVSTAEATGACSEPVCEMWDSYEEIDIFSALNGPVTKAVRVAVDSDL